MKLIICIGDQEHVFTDVDPDDACAMYARRFGWYYGPWKQAVTARVELRASWVADVVLEGLRQGALDPEVEKDLDRVWFEECAVVEFDALD